MERFEFGPFRLEKSPPALYRGEEFIPVTPKALDTLMLLVEEAGRVVTKEQLMQRVWPDAFVEDGNLANNISALRKILNPHFEGDGPIATIARRGYRFTASVTHAPPRQAPQAPEAPTAPYAPYALYARYAPYAPVLVASLIVLSAIAFASWKQLSFFSPAPVVRRSVAVLPMKNLSGDASQQWLSIALAETISAELAGGGHQFRVVSGENVLRMQLELAPPIGVGLTRKQLDDIGRDLASDLILTGNFIVVGGKIRVDVRLDEVATGAAIASASITDAEDRFLEIVLKAGSDLRAALDLDQPPAADADAMRAAFTATPEALRNYFQGLEALRLRDGPKARDFLAAAIAADDSFALAHSAISTTWRLLGYDKLGAASAKRALDLSARLSPEDRLGVEAQYHEATASWPQAIALYQQLWQRYPDNIEYGLKLGNAQFLGAKSADALVTVAALRRLPERDSRDSRIDLLEATAADALADYPRAIAAAATAADKARAAGANLMLARARIKQGIYDSRLGKRREAQQHFAEAATLFGGFNETGGVADALRWRGVVAADAGRLDEADRLFAQALALATTTNYIRLATELRLAMASQARTRGDRARAIALDEEALAAAREADNRSQQSRALYGLGTALRQQGEYARARESFRQSAEIATAIGDLRTLNISLTMLGLIEFQAGDLAAARRAFETVLASDREIGAPGAVANRLGHLSRVRHLQGELVEAEKLNAEECGLYEQLKATANLAWCRTRLAQLWIDLGRTSEATALAKQQTLADFGSAVLAPIAIARFARLQLALGHMPEAVKTIEHAEKVQAAAGPVEEQAIHVSVIRAEVEAAQGKRAAAVARLNRAIADADKRGLVTWSLDAKRVLSRIGSS